MGRPIESIGRERVERDVWRARRGHSTQCSGRQEKVHLELLRVSKKLSRGVIKLRPSMRRISDTGRREIAYRPAGKGLIPRWKPRGFDSNLLSVCASQCVWPLVGAFCFLASPPAADAYAAAAQCACALMRVLHAADGCSEDETQATAPKMNFRPLRREASALLQPLLAAHAAGGCEHCGRRIKKSAAQQRSQPAQQRCSLCGELGHKRSRCVKGAPRKQQRLMCGLVATV